MVWWVLYKWRQTYSIMMMDGCLTFSDRCNANEKYLWVLCYVQVHRKTNHPTHTHYSDSESSANLCSHSTILRAESSNLSLLTMCKVSVLTWSKITCLEMIYTTKKVPMNTVSYIIRSVFELARWNDLNKHTEILSL